MEKQGKKYLVEIFLSARTRAIHVFEFGALKYNVFKGSKPGYLVNNGQHYITIYIIIHTVLPHLLQLQENSLGFLNHVG